MLRSRVSPSHSTPRFAPFTSSRTLPSSFTFIIFRLYITPFYPLQPFAAIAVTFYSDFFFRPLPRPPHLLADKPREDRIYDREVDDKFRERILRGIRREHGSEVDERGPRRGKKKDGPRCGLALPNIRARKLFSSTPFF